MAAQTLFWVIIKQSNLNLSKQTIFLWYVRNNYFGDARYQNTMMIDQFVNLWSVKWGGSLWHRAYLFIYLYSLFPLLQRFINCARKCAKCAVKKHTYSLMYIIKIYKKIRFHWRNLCDLIVLYIVVNIIIRPGIKPSTSWYASQVMSLILCYDRSVSIFTLSATYLKNNQNRHFEIPQHVSKSIENQGLWLISTVESGEVVIKVVLSLICFEW